MKILRSVCTNMAFPDTRKSLDAFRRTAEFLAERGIRSLEFYHDGPETAKIGPLLSDLDMTGVWIGVIPSKEQKLDLCSPERWREAARYYAALLDTAQAAGIKTLMLNSGRIDSDPEKQLDALAESVAFLHNHADKKGYSAAFVLEPGDSHMASCQLLGPYPRVLAFCERMERSGTPLYLTMDSAHSAEEGESFPAAVRAVKKYCRHIHFANCFIRDETSPLYGDQHVGFDYPDTEWDYDSLKTLQRELEGIYPGEETVKIALEYLCREEDPYACFEKYRKAMPFWAE